MEIDLKQRDRSVLQAIIATYIHTGEPVGSRYLSKKLDFDLSSATIRNIMSDLEEMGYLQQPHISAGRVPTDKAYRFYVDCMVRRDPEANTRSNLENACRNLRDEPEKLMRGTSRALSDISRYISLVTAPRFINTVFKHIEFVKLKNKILAIIVSQEGLIQNKIVTTDKNYSQQDLNRISNILNSRYANKPLKEVRSRIIEEMTEEKNLYESMLGKVMELGKSAFDLDNRKDSIYVEGTSNIFSLPEFADIERMKALFKAFEEKSHLVEILDRCIDAERVKIYIGAENPYHEMHNLSLVTAPYSKGGKVLGVIGVLGPTRMEYDRVISIVDYTARYLTRLLTDRY